MHRRRESLSFNCLASSLSSFNNCSDIIRSKWDAGLTAPSKGLQEQSLVFKGNALFIQNWANLEFFHTQAQWWGLCKQAGRPAPSLFFLRSLTWNTPFLNSFCPKPAAQHSVFPRLLEPSSMGIPQRLHTAEHPATWEQKEEDCIQKERSEFILAEVSLLWFTLA